MSTFQELIRNLSHFWEKQGCVIHQGYDLEVGAGTSNPATFLRCLGPEPYKAAYVEPCRRPTDGRYGNNPNRLQHYFQFQVILKPSPPDIQSVYLQSLEAIGLKLSEHDIRFVHDDWEQPTLGAAGLGWEAWCDGMEVSQITYFQSFAGIDVKPVTGEITYGLERLAMYLQDVNHFTEIQWNQELTYGDIYQRNEWEWSTYNFEKANTEMWFRHFDDYEKEARTLIAQNLPLAAYDFVIKSSHAFNILDARGAISVTERTGYIARIRSLACQIAQSYIQSREEQGFPLLKRFAKPEHTSIPKQTSATLSGKDISEADDFVLEIGSEELPATFVPVGLANLEKDLRQLLQKEGLSFQAIKTYGTPRRLTAYVEKLGFGKQEKSAEKKGPPLSQLYDAQGSLTSVGEGFFRSINQPAPSLTSLRENKVKDCSIRAIKEIDYVFVQLKTPAKSTSEILTEHLPRLILNLEFPKKMRWADLDITYARPILWLLAIHGSSIVPFTVANIHSGNESKGHRQLCPQTFPLTAAQDYVQELKKHFVLVDIQERKQCIISQLDALEKEIRGTISERERVVPEVLNLVEWPMVAAVDFNPSFLKAPKELLISEMVEHQRYFPVINPDGSLKNLFIITANSTPTEHIRQGNRKVLSARLSDGVFLYEQDLKVPLETFNEKLGHVTFQKDLGSVFDKVKRIVAHVEVIQRMLNMGDFATARRAALFCKADLASTAVYEFPELQGIMGKYYALAHQESSIVAKAIEEHWMPRGESAPLPETAEGIIVSLADKIDNLIGCFSVGLKPTSSSDPYALRRQVLGMIKMLINGKYSLPLKEVFLNCLNHFPKPLQAKSSETWKEIEAFILNRVKTVFQDFGFSKDEIDASISFGINDLYDTYCRIQALHQFRASNQFSSLYEVYKRAKGQVNTHEVSTFSSHLLKEEAEKELNQLLYTIQGQFQQAINNRKYDLAYTLIAQIQPALAKLFSEVKILADDSIIRENRIALLQKVFQLFAQLLDFSKIQEI